MHIIGSNWYQLMVKTESKHKKIFDTMSLMWFQKAVGPPVSIRPKASSCTLIQIGKLKFGNIVGMNLSKKRQDVLALSERPPEKQDPWTHFSIYSWTFQGVILCFALFCQQLSSTLHFYMMH